MDKQETPRKTNKPIQTALLIVLVILLAIGGYFLADALGADNLFSKGAASASPSLSPKASIKPSPKASTLPKTIRVKVMGAVKNPGDYVLPRGSIYQQAVEKAGGFTENAEISTKLLGTVLEDKAVIMVPSKSD